MSKESKGNRVIGEFFARPDLIIPETKVTIVGNLGVVGVYDAPRIDISTLIGWAVASGLPPTQREDAFRLIEDTGFPNRLISEAFQNPRTQEEVEQHAAEKGAEALTQVMSAMDWPMRSLGAYFDTSSTLDVGHGRLVLEQAGFSTEEIQKVKLCSYRLACGSFPCALMDVLSDPTLQNMPVVIGSNEPLDSLLEPDMFTTLEDLVIPGIFGNKYTAVGFIPNRLELKYKEAVIIANSVIRVKTYYDFTGLQHDPSAVKPWYRFREPSDQSVLKVTDEAVVLEQKAPPDGRRWTIDGRATGTFFGDETARRVREMLTETENPNLIRDLCQVDFPDTGSGKIKKMNLVIHQASAPVIRRLARELYKAGSIDSRKHLPFLMGLIGESNSSSATTPTVLQYLLEHNLIDSKDDIVFLAPGAGAVIASCIVRFR